MTSKPITLPTEPELAAYAAALIDRERRDAQVGLRTLIGFFGLGAIGSAVIALLVAQSHRVLALPAVVVVALIVFALGRRLFRFVRAINKLQQGWREGRLSNGELALDVARQHANGR